MLNEEQVKGIKEQIIKQIDSWHATPEQKEQAKKQILGMSSKELEEFLIKNKLIKQQEGQATPKQEQCPFCLIVKEAIPSYKIDENKDSIAVLEINPLSKGHSLIILKEHKSIDKIPTTAFILAKKIARRIKSRLKAKSVSIQTAELLGHSAINVIPVYENEQLKKHKASESELKQLQKKLKAAPKKEKKKKPVKELPEAPKRIP